MARPMNNNFEDSFTLIGTESESAPTDYHIIRDTSRRAIISPFYHSSIHFDTAGASVDSRSESPFLFSNPSNPSSLYFSMDQEQGHHQDYSMSPHGTAHTAPGDTVHSSLRSSYGYMDESQDHGSLLDQHEQASRSDFVIAREDTTRVAAHVGSWTAMSAPHTDEPTPSQSYHLGINGEGTTESLQIPPPARRLEPPFSAYNLTTELSSNVSQDVSGQSALISQLDRSHIGQTRHFPTNTHQQLDSAHQNDETPASMPRPQHVASQIFPNGPGRIGPRNGNGSKVECHNCNKWFAPSSISKHKQTHQAGRHICPQCPRRFRQGRDLTRHIEAVHYHQRNHICGQCGREFSRSDNLTRHMSNLHVGRSRQGDNLRHFDEDEEV